MVIKNIGLQSNVTPTSSSAWHLYFQIPELFSVSTANALSSDDRFTNHYKPVCLLRFLSIQLSSQRQNNILLFALSWLKNMKIIQHV